MKFGHKPCLVLQKPRKIQAENSSRPSCVQCRDRQIIVRQGQNSFLTGEICSCFQKTGRQIYLDNQTYERYYKWKKTDNHSKFTKIDLDLFSQYEEDLKKASKSGELQDSLLDRIGLLESAGIPNRFLGGEFLTDVPENATKWFEESMQGTSKSLLLCGNIGTGKTHLSASFAISAVLDYGLSVRFLTSDFIVQIYKDKRSAPFNSHARFDSEETWNAFLSEINSIHLMIFDDIGKQNPSDTITELYEIFIDRRYKTGRNTIYTTNHSYDKETSLHGATLNSRIGERAADRLRECVTIRFDEISRRKDPGTLHSDIPVEIRREFLMPVPEGLTSILMILARNPIFDIVSPQERADLTARDDKGQFIEKHRSGAKVVNNAWENGTHLMVQGPKVDIGDHLVYLALVELLHDQHRSLKSGLDLVTTYSEIRKKLSLKSTGRENTEKLRRSITRLAQVSIEFRSEKKERWRGGMISSFYEEGSLRSSRLLIRFNPDMINLYKHGRYFSVKLSQLQDLSQWAIVLLLFLDSHDADKKEFSLESIRNVIGSKPQSDKELRRQIRNALEELRKAGFQAEEARLEGERLYTMRQRRARELAQEVPTPS